MKTKTLIFLLLCALFTMPVMAQTEEETDVTLARCSKASGKLIFMRCEPIAEYEVVFELAPKGITHGLEDVVDMIITTALRISKKKGIDFDAVIIGSTRKDIAIKFKK